MDKRNIINLGIIGSSAELRKGVKNTYYIYYKADGDLYMYDSFKDVETNLFRLTLPPRGKLEILANIILKGVLKIFSFKSLASTLTITAFKSDGDAIPDTQGIKLYLREIGDANGILSITALQDVARGTIELYLKGPAATGGVLSITAYQAPSKGTIELTLKQEGVADGTLSITAYNVQAYGNVQLQVRTEEVISDGFLSITATKDFAKGIIEITIKDSL